MTVPPKGFSEKRKQLLEQKRHVTGKVSDLCRYIGFGLLAVFYTLQIGDTEFATGVREHGNVVLVGIGLSGACAIFFDYIQFVFGALSVEDALNHPSQEYNKNSWVYRGREYAFFLKQLATLSGAALLIVLVFA